MKTSGPVLPRRRQRAKGVRIARFPEALGKAVYGSECAIHPDRGASRATCPGREWRGSNRRKSFRYSLYNRAKRAASFRPARNRFVPPMGTGAYPRGPSRCGPFRAPRRTIFRKRYRRESDVSRVSCKKYIISRTVSNLLPSGPAEGSRRVWAPYFFLAFEAEAVLLSFRALNSLDPGLIPSSLATKPQPFALFFR